MRRMTQQFDLAGFDPPPKLTDRLFFALFPSEETIAQIVKTSLQLRKEHGLTGKSLSNDRLDVTQFTRNSQISVKCVHKDSQSQRNTHGNDKGRDTRVSD
jgi:hypothetical protein